MVVDEDAFICELIGAQLAARGYLVLTMADAEAALEEAAHRRPAAVVCNVDAARFDSEVFYKRMRSRHGNVPFVFLVSQQLADHAAAHSFARAGDILAKPFDPDELDRRLKKVLDAPIVDDKRHF